MASTTSSSVAEAEFHLTSSASGGSDMQRGVQTPAVSLDRDPSRKASMQTPTTERNNMLPNSSKSSRNSSPCNRQSLPMHQGQRPVSSDVARSPALSVAAEQAQHRSSSGRPTPPASQRQQVGSPAPLESSTNTRSIDDMPELPESPPKFPDGTIRGFTVGKQNRRTGSHDTDCAI